MTRQRKDDAIHDLKRKNKELQDEIKRLSRKINNEAKEEKRASRARNKEKVIEVEPENPPVHSTCTCGEGNLVLSNGCYTCNNCQNQEKCGI